MCATVVQSPGIHFVDTASGRLPLNVPNEVTEGDGFYISHLGNDGVYGCETTALVLGQMEKFYILCGDHRAAYAPLISQGFEACLAYFRGKPELVHQRSDKLLG